MFAIHLDIRDVVLEDGRDIDLVSAALVLSHHAFASGIVVCGIETCFALIEGT